MLPVHQRLAELYTISRSRPLSAAEITEQRHCLHANEVYCWEMGRLNNEAQLAAQTADAEWQQQISAQLLELRINGRVDKRRK